MAPLPDYATGDRLSRAQGAGGFGDLRHSKTASRKLLALLWPYSIQPRQVALIAAFMSDYSLRSRHHLSAIGDPLDMAGAPIKVRRPRVDDATGGAESCCNDDENYTHHGSVPKPSGRNKVHASISSFHR